MIGGRSPRLIQQNAAASEQMAASAEELSGQAEQLQSTVAFFVVDEQHRATVRATPKA